MSVRPFTAMLDPDVQRRVVPILLSSAPSVPVYWANIQSTTIAALGDGEIFWSSGTRQVVNNRIVYQQGRASWNWLGQSRTANEEVWGLGLVLRTEALLIGYQRFYAPFLIGPGSSRFVVPIEVLAIKSFG